MCTLIGTFGAKYITFDLKKYRGIIFHDTEESRKIWRKTDLCFQKWHEEYSPEHSESLKIGTLIGSFIQSRKYMSLKITRELCVMIVENDAKFEEELTLRILTWALENLKNLHFIGCFWPNYIVCAKKVQKKYVWWHWRLMETLQENWLVLSKMKWRIWQISIHRLKNSDFILESKMAELNQNKHSKQPDRPDAEWKLYFTLEINE